MRPQARALHTRMETGLTTEMTSDHPHILGLILVLLSPRIINIDLSDVAFKLHAHYGISEIG